MVMTKKLRFWVATDCGCLRDDQPDLHRAQLLGEVLRRYEQAGDAMRYLNARGQIAWKAAPRMLRRLEDAEQEVTDDWDDCCGRLRRPGRNCVQDPS
jgi:hypothetical protein